MQDIQLKLHTVMYCDLPQLKLLLLEFWCIWPWCALVEKWVTIGEVSPPVRWTVRGRCGFTWKSSLESPFKQNKVNQPISIGHLITPHTVFISSDPYGQCPLEKFEARGMCLHIDKAHGMPSWVHSTWTCDTTFLSCRYFSHEVCIMSQWKGKWLMEEGNGKMICLFGSLSYCALRPQPIIYL